MDLRDYLRVLRSRWVLITAITLVGVAAAAAVTFAMTPVYRSTTTVYVSAGDAQSSVGSAYTGSLLAQQRVTSYVDVARSQPIAQAIVTDLGLAMSSDAVISMMSVDNPTDTVLIDLSVSNADPALAQSIANAWVTQLTQAVEEIEASGTGGTSLFKLSVVEPASLPTSPYSPRVAINLALGLLVGLAVGVGAAVLLETLDTRVKNVDDLPTLVGAPLLGAVALDPEVAKYPLIVRDRPYSPQAEAFRALRTNLQFVEVDHRRQLIVVTSAMPGEGKSTVAANLALALAEAGTDVALVEGDLRNPVLAAQLGLDPESPGLSDVLIGRATLDQAIKRFNPNSTLWVMHSGALPPNPSELLGSRQMRIVLEELRRVTVVIIDTPPLLPVTDGAVLAALTDGAILVNAVGSTRREQVRRAAEQLDTVNARLLGVVANRASANGSDAGAYGGAYAYGYSYAAQAHHLKDEVEGQPTRRVEPYVPPSFPPDFPAASDRYDGPARPPPTTEADASQPTVAGPS